MSYFPVPDYSPGVSGGILTANDITGTVAGDDAGLAYVGRIETYSVASGSAVSLTTNVYANVISMSINAGDWDFTGVVIANAAAITGTYFEASWGTTSATPTGSEFDQTFTPTMPTAACQQSLTLPMYRASVIGSTTLYVVVKMIFTAGSPSVYCGIRARRRR